MESLCKKNLDFWGQENLQLDNFHDRSEQLLEQNTIGDLVSSRLTLEEFEC